ncbi:MAG: sulfatase [Myxococcales bacterium]|nr:sulfatase [Myxococcales bacterium]
MDRSGNARFATLRDALERQVENRRLWLSVAVLLCLAHFARLYDPNQALLTDTRYFTFFGMEVAKGAVPHLDFFDNKTQLASLVAGGFVWFGDVLGRGAVESIRLGNLGLAAFGGVLLFLLHRIFAAGRSIPGLLGLLPYLGLTYIGTLAATGSIPKLIMAVSATAAALAVARGRWFVAGLVSAIAPLDWQIGLFACVGVAAAAAIDANPRRALMQSALGIAAVAAIFIGYFALNGALELMLAHTVGASFARGAEAGGPFFKFAAIQRGLLWHCAGEFWLIGLGMIGTVILPFWFRSERFRSMRKPLLVVAVFHYGIVAFSCIDFQGSGDTMLLLHSVAFFAGVTLVSLYLGLDEYQQRQTGMTNPWLGAMVVAIVLVLTRPVFSEPAKLWTPDSPVSVTLQDQLTMARRLAPILKDRSLLVLGPAEMLVLGGFSHESIYVFWNDATKFEYARTHPDKSSNLLADLVAELKPGVILASRYQSLPPDIPYRGVDLGTPGGYAVRVFVRLAASDESPGDATGNLSPSLAPTPRATRVVLITLDTLRRDSFEPNAEIGEAGSSAMPLTRDWAHNGVVFDRHYAASSTTQPTHASLLTGLHPWQHGVSRNGQALAAEHTTLAEVFSQHGFHTGAVVSSFPLHRSFGFDQGFDRFDDSFEIPVTMEWSGRAVPNGAFYSLGSSITAKALAMLDQLEGPQQFFWFHYFDLHEPYGDADAEGRDDVVKLAEIYARLESGDPNVVSMVEHAKRRYEDDARVLDRELDQLIRRLYRDAETVDTHLLVVSDHGESFGELGSLGHGKRLSDELIHVPCFMISPRLDPGRIDVPVGSIDVPVTLLSLAGFSDDSGLTSSGRDMTRALPSTRSVFGMRRTFAEPFHELRLDGRRHLLLDPVFFVANSGGVTIGNAEQIIRGPDLEDSNVRSLFKVFAQEHANAGSGSVLSEESRAALEALGYVQ